MAINNTSVLHERPSNFTTFTDFVTEYPHNILMDGLYGPALLAVIFTIAMVNLSVRTDSKRAFVASSFITFIAATLGAALDIVGGVSWLITVLMVVIGTLLNRGGDRV